MKAKYCKAENTYKISECRNCTCGYVWKQGIGSLVGQGSSVITRQVFKSDYNIRVEADGGLVLESTCLEQGLKEFGIGKSLVDA